MTEVRQDTEEFSRNTDLLWYSEASQWLQHEECAKMLGNQCITRGSLGMGEGDLKSSLDQLWREQNGPTEYSERHRGRWMELTSLFLL